MFKLPYKELSIFKVILYLEFINLSLNLFNKIGGMSHVTYPYFWGEGSNISKLYLLGTKLLQKCRLFTLENRLSIKLLKKDRSETMNCWLGNHLDPDILIALNLFKS